MPDLGMGSLAVEEEYEGRHEAPDDEDGHRDLEDSAGCVGGGLEEREMRLIGFPTS